MNYLKNPVLKGLSPDDIQQFRLYCCMREKQYKKDEVIFRAGDRTEELGIVLEGDVLIENIDLWDNMTILSSIGTGGAFAETYALLDEP
ncbi:MAG: cyclic nucleotide-binding domain-containing protein, partial [Lachnospiraceae bacterium]|nr:cyclic nucleotide-binding domain-containing protein [Lachnospiraceae bacterium]